MAEKTLKRPLHTGFTEKGNTCDLKVERVGKVTIYRRGEQYYLYYRQDQKTERCRIDGNLAVARATAAKVATALAEERPSPLNFQRPPPLGRPGTRSPGQSPLPANAVL